MRRGQAGRVRRRAAGRQRVALQPASSGPTTQLLLTADGVPDLLLGQPHQSAFVAADRYGRVQVLNLLGPTSRVRPPFRAG